MKRTIIIISVIVILLALAGGTYYYKSNSSGDEKLTPTDSLFFTSITSKTVATGSINPRKEIELKSQVSGVIEELYVEPGDLVKKGDLVAKIRIIQDVVALNNAQANLKTAQINFNNAQKEKNRQYQLFEEKVISEFEYNQFLLSYNLAKQQLEAAENNLDLIKEGASKKSGTVSNLVQSTVAGMVLDTPFKEGNFIIESNTFNEGSTIASVADMSEMIFEGNVDESEVGKLKLGMELNLDIGALDNDDYTAKLEYISPKGIEEEGAIKFEIRAAIQLQEGTFLRAGYSANADIVIDKRENVLSVKESNVIYEEDKKFVEVLENDSSDFKKVEIETGISDGINVEVVGGVSEDSRVRRL
jgi:HlyD family secretion protein